MSMTKEELAMLLTSYEMLKIDVDLKDVSMVSKITTNEHTIRKAITEECDKKCKSWFDCDNPFRDCVNCPLRYQTAGYPINSTNDYISEINSTDDYYSNVNSTDDYISEINSTNECISEIISTKDEYDYLRENPPH